MKYEVKKSKSKYVGFLQLSEGMQVYCTLGKRKVHDPESEKGRPSVHYAATLDQDCEYILKREGNSERMILGKVGDLLKVLQDECMNRNVRLTALERVPHKTRKKDGKPVMMHTFDIEVDDCNRYQVKERP